MSDFYIAPGGSDAGAGSIGDPWENLSYAIANVGPGDNINCAAGAYAADVGATISAPVNVVGPNSGVPYDGVRVAEAVFDLSSPLEIKAPTVLDGVKLTGAPVTNVQLFVGSGIDNTQIINNVISGATLYGIRAASTTAPVNVLGLVIKDNHIDGTSGSMDRCLYIFPTTPGGDQALIVDAIVTGNKLEGATWGNSLDNMPGVTFEDNIIKNCSRALVMHNGSAGTGASWLPAASYSNNTFISDAAGNRYFMGIGHPTDGVPVDETVVFDGNTFEVDTDTGPLGFAYCAAAFVAEGLTFTSNSLAVTGSAVATTIMLFTEPGALGAGTYTVTDNTADGGTVSTVAPSWAFNFDTGGGGIPVGAIFRIKRNGIQGFHTAVVFHSGGTPGGLPAGIDVEVNQHDFSANTYGIANDAPGVIDGRFNCWGGSGASGGAVDPTTGEVADGDGAGLFAGTDPFYVQFDPETCGYTLGTEPTARTLSGAAPDVAGGDPAATYAVPDSESGQSAIEKVRDSSGATVHAGPGSHVITAGAPGGAVPRALNEDDSQKTLIGKNAGVIIPWDDTPGRFVEPGKA